MKYLKKFLILLGVCLTSFLLIDNASAENLTYHSDKPLEYTTMTNTIDLSDEEVTTLMKKANYTDDLIERYLIIRNYALQNNQSGKYYFVNPGDSSIFYYDRIFINMSYENINQGWIEVTYASGLNQIWYNIQSNYSSYTYYQFNGSTSNPNSSTSGWFASNTLFLTYNTKNNIIDSNNYQLNYFYETNMKGQLKYKKGAFGGTSDIIIDDVTYSINDTLPITLENGYHSLRSYGPVEPELQYKTGFTSSESYSVLGKISNNFSISDNKFILDFKNYKFKLQFGSNDFTEENIPVFSHYKIFGLNRGTNTWEKLDKYFDNNFFKLDIIETTYDYSENMLADASITMQLNFNSSDEEIETFNTLYSKIKLEFYLENTQNGYIYCYDNLSSSNWEDTPKFLEDYIYYYFPSNYKYAFISSNNNINEGKIYFPTNSINNELVKLQGQYYNLEKHNFSFPIVTNLYLNDDYYSYFDFYFNDTENILLLNRAVGSYIYESWYNTTFLEHWNESLFLDYISISEDTYFYVPIGYNVYFTNNTNITINTSNGNINIDIENSKNDYENNIYNDNITGNSFFDLFIKSFNFFIIPINSLFSLISLFFSILPIGIQYMLYVSFGFIIALIIYKFVL